MVNILITKNILKKVNINPIFFFLAFISFITGLFKEFLVFTSIILIHELGHVLVALYYKWNIKKINIYPFGGIITFDELLNKPINEELLIVISGVIMQSIYFVFIYFLYKNMFISSYIYNLFYHYHFSILFFNLIFIYPLDGIRIVNLILSKYFNYNLSHKLCIIISCIFLLIFIYFSIRYYLSMNIILIVGLLIKEICKEKKEHNNMCSKFVFERYLYDLDFKKVKTINNNNLYRDYKHVIKKDGTYITEKKLLKEKYEKFRF